jgi:peroxiredoxin Q/BCP
VEARGFQVEIPHFEGARIIGVSPDSVNSQIKFAQKLGVTFTLLSDPERMLIEACGVWVEKNMYGNKLMGVERATFLLDEKAIIRKIWRKVKPDGHAKEVQAALCK